MRTDSILQFAAERAQRYVKQVGERRVAPTENDLAALAKFHEPFPAGPSDPRDVVLSCFRRTFMMNASMFEFTTLERSARFYDAVMRLSEIYREKLGLPWHTLTSAVSTIPSIRAETDTGQLSMFDLVRHALRFQPDRLVLGESRGEEMAAVCKALMTGHDFGADNIQKIWISMFIGAQGKR